MFHRNPRGGLGEREKTSGKTSPYRANFSRYFKFCQTINLVPRACDPREGTRGSGIIRCRKPGILAKIELRIPFQRPIRFLPETDYPGALRFVPMIAGSGNEISKLLQVFLGARQPHTQAIFSHTRWRDICRVSVQLYREALLD